MKVEIEGLAEYPGWREMESCDAGELDRLRKEACANARKALPEWKASGDGDHLVYYYELTRKSPDDNVAVVLMTPQSVKDDAFQNFVNNFKPAYVGAIHKF